ncbi:MAG: hypothetical protein ACOYVK_08425 [Bacillota bacterium]
METQAKENELTVFIATKSSVCEDCGEQIEQGDYIVKEKNDNIICISCADLDHLIYLPSGNTALTGRARKHSKESTF